MRLFWLFVFSVAAWLFATRWIMGKDSKFVTYLWSRRVLTVTAMAVAAVGLVFYVLSLNQWKIW